MAREASAPKNFVAVGCKLPHGIVLEHPMDKKVTVKLNGLNTAKIIGATYVITPVDADFWDNWIAVNAEFPAVKSNAIFVTDSYEKSESKGKELAKEKTGFEPIKPGSHGIKTADKE